MNTLTKEELRARIEKLFNSEYTIGYNDLFKIIPGYSYQYWGDETGSYDISYYNKPVMRFRDRGFVMYL